MKKIQFLFLAVFLTVFWSCKKDREILEPPVSIDSEVQSTHSSLCGLENGSFNQPEGADYRQRFAAGFSILNTCDPIKIFIPATCSGGINNWTPAINAALFEYNNTPTSIRFVSVPTAAEADFILACTNISNGCPIGVASPSPLRLSLNTSSLSAFCLCGTTAPLTPGQLKYAVMHELGHILGIGHTNDVNDVLINGTPTNDSKSIFNGGGTEKFCSSVPTFSTDDLATLKLLYPIQSPPSTGIGGPSLLCQGAVGTFCIPTTTPVTTWNAPPSIEGMTTPCVTFSSTERGDHIIRATVVSNGCEYEVSKTVHVGAPNYPNISVIFDPCNSLITLNNENNLLNYSSYTQDYNFNWTVSGLRNAPQILNNGRNSKDVRVLYSAGEMMCVGLTVTNPCGSTSTECDVCFLTPDCEGDGLPIKGVIANRCGISSSCPEGYQCVNGICCPGEINPNACETAADCPDGYECFNGNCRRIVDDSSIPCNDYHDCPPKHFCKNRKCIPVPM